MSSQPNVLIILNDDMGYSDIGCYGGEIDTPNLDLLAGSGLRFSQFYNTARCCPSRASLLTGLHPHQAGVGHMTNDDSPEGYPGSLNDRCVTIAEVLREGGYETYMSGKWHVASDVSDEKDAWPLQRGFSRYYGILAGAASYFRPLTLTRDNECIDEEPLPEGYYLTDAISDNAVGFIEEHVSQHSDRPFFQYVAYTAPHWPLHAIEEDVAKYRGRFDQGWDVLREQRLERLRDEGILSEEWPLTDRDPSQPAWEDASDRDYLARCMEVYAAQVDRMDQGIGRIIETLKRTGQYENTVIIFLSDNGGCAEVLEAPTGEWLQQAKLGTKLTRDGELVQYGNGPTCLQGPENSYQSYGVAWANLSNTPFRLYKHWVHEGGIATPFIVHWPAGIGEPGAIRHEPCQLTDVMPTILEITGGVCPERFDGRDILPPEGVSMVPVIEGSDGVGERPLFWEHEGNAAVRDGRWKLVRRYPGDWELFDMELDRTETQDVAPQHPDTVRRMSEMYAEWAQRCGVVPWEKLSHLY